MSADTDRAEVPRSGPEPSGSSRVAAGIAASRTAGLLREVAIGGVLGSSAVADAFRAAMRVPNLVQNLLGEGALSASFVPVYAQLVERDDEKNASRVAGAVLGFLSLAVSGLVALIVVLAGPIVTLTTLGGFEGERYDLTVSLTRLTALGVGLLAMGAWCIGILNAHRRYFLSYAAPVVWNAAQIVALVTAGVIGVVGEALDPDSIARWLAAAMVIGSALQFLVLWRSVQANIGVIPPSLTRSRMVDTVLRRFAPAVAARGALQLSSYLDLALAGLIVAGGPSLLWAAIILYVLPVSLFGFSVATAELTEVSRAGGDEREITRRVRMGLRKVALPAGACTAALIFAGTGIGSTLYQLPNELFGSDSWSTDQTIVFGLIVGALGLGLPAAMTVHVHQNALYAIGDVRGPARIAGIRLVVLAIASAVLMVQLDRLYVSGGTLEGAGELPVWPLWDLLDESERNVVDAPPHLGAVGIALGTSIAAWVEWVLLRRRLNRKLNTRLRSGLAVEIVAATAVAGVAALATRYLLPLPLILDGPVTGLVVLTSYMGALHMLGVRPRTPLPPGSPP